MNPGEDIPKSIEAFSASEVERLLEKVASSEESDVANASREAKELVKEDVGSHDFRNPTLLNQQELRKLRAHQEEFVKALASRLSLHLRLEFSLKLSGLQTVAYQKLAENLATPSHLMLFKIEPLRGLSLLELRPRLGSSIVDRLMGGSGNCPETPHEISEIEKALLEQVAQLILAEWCNHWSRLQELKPALLGYENNGRFIQDISSETIMLALTLEARMGDCVEKIHLGVPFAVLEGLIRRLTHSGEAVKEAAAAPVPAGPFKWNPCLDEVCIPVSAKWQGFEMSAREVLGLKVGDVLQVDPETAQRVNVRLGDLPKFNGRLGTVAGKWAVELTQVVDRQT